MKTECKTENCKTEKLPQKQGRRPHRTYKQKTHLLLSYLQKFQNNAKLISIIPNRIKQPQTKQETKPLSLFNHVQCILYSIKVGGSLTTYLPALYRYISISLHIYLTILYFFFKKNPLLFFYT